MRTTITIGEEYVDDLLRSTGETSPASAARVFIERGLRAAALRRALDSLPGFTIEQINEMLIEDGFDPVEVVRAS
jgi:hypothetical protein